MKPSVSDPEGNKEAARRRPKRTSELLWGFLLAGLAIRVVDGAQLGFARGTFARALHTRRRDGGIGERGGRQPPARRHGVQLAALAGGLLGDPAPTVVFVQDVGRMRQQAQQMKLVALGRLTASIAHEIRNPLSSIGHAAELLDEDPAMGEGEKRLISIIHGNVGRLDRIVQEILYLNRRDRAHPEAIDATTYLGNFAQEFCSVDKVPADCLDIQARTTLRMWFDRQHLYQVLWNLVRNAWRHSQKRPGSVRVLLGPSPAPGHLVLDVHDDGPGVPPGAQAHLFEPFFTTEAQGTGLGLYIARELCEGNGARLEYVDNPGGGQFRITLKGA